MAEAFARAGARVYINARKAEACESAATEISKFGHCIAIPGNVATTEGRSTVITALGQHETALDVLINNAGSLWAAPIDDYPEAGWDKVYDLNVKATFYLIQKFLPMLEASATRQSPARIINVGSANALRLPAYETYAYASSKAAVHNLTRHLAGQLAARHITVNVIAPGRFPTTMQTVGLEKDGGEELLDVIPLRRLGAATDIAGVSIYLASPAGSYVTGTVISVDGGMATT